MCLKYLDQPQHKPGFKVTLLIRVCLIGNNNLSNCWQSRRSVPVPDVMSMLREGCKQAE